MIHAPRRRQPSRHPVEVPLVITNEALGVWAVTRQPKAVGAGALDVVGARRATRARRAVAAPRVAVADAYAAAAAGAGLAQDWGLLEGDRGLRVVATAPAADCAGATAARAAVAALQPMVGPMRFRSPFITTAAIVCSTTSACCCCCERPAASVSCRSNSSCITARWRMDASCGSVGMLVVLRLNSCTGRR